VSPRPLLRAVISSALLSLSGCDLLEDAPSADSLVKITVKIKAVDESGRGVPGTQISLGKTLKGETDKDGLLLLPLSGQPGKVAPLTIKCPQGFASPEKTVDVGMTQLASGSPVPLFETHCTALLRSVVVGIRTENGAGLPVMYLGKEVARTDATGSAHVLLTVAPGETASLSLDTTGSPLLKPQNPNLLFKVGTKDEMVLLEQKFTVTQKQVYVRPVARPKPL